MSEHARRRPARIIPVETVETTAVTGEAQELAPEAKEFASRSRSANTRRVYEVQWKRFERWCELKGLASKPASRHTVANYLAYLANFGREPELDLALEREGPLKASSIKQAKAVIGKAHRNAGVASPTETREVMDVWEGIQRTLGCVVDKKTPIMPSQLAAMIDLTPNSILGARDRAILLLGWAGAFRRSELVAVDFEDLFRGDEPGTLVIFIRRSKTDQRGTGRKKPIFPSEDAKLCPIRAVAAWLMKSGIVAGPLFRPTSPDGSLLERRLSDDMVYETVVRYAVSAGLKPGEFGGFGAHSLRAGFCTAAGIARKDLSEIMKVTHHAKVDTVLGYIRDAELFTERSAGRGLLDGAKTSGD